MAGGDIGTCVIARHERIPAADVPLDRSGMPDQRAVCGDPAPFDRRFRSPRRVEALGAERFPVEFFARCVNGLFRSWNDDPAFEQQDDSMPNTTEQISETGA